MTITVDAVPLSPTCNSYVTVAEADAYVTDRITDAPTKTAWSALSADAKATAVVNATRAVDNFADFIGSKYSRDQNLKWPRYNAWVDGYYLDPDKVPLAIKEATIEMAAWTTVNKGQIAVEQAGAAYDSIKVGPINIDFNESNNGPQYKYFPDIVAYILTDYGTVNNPQLPASNQVKTVRLIRA